VKKLRPELKNIKQLIVKKLMRVKEPRERLKKLKNGQPMSKKEIDDAAIALKKEKERARKAAYRAANPEKVKAEQAEY